MAIHPAAMFASMARCAALRRVPPAMTAALIVGTKALMEAIVDDNGSDFDLSGSFPDLADFERTGATGRMGNGFADLCMTAMGYAWRDLSVQLMPRGSGRLGDFIYGGPSTAGFGVVMCEAKASTGAAVALSDVRKDAENGYLAQVAPHIGSLSSAGKIFQGYAVGFGARPGNHGAHGHLVQTPVAGRGGSVGVRTRASTPGRVPGFLAAGTYRAVFDLINAPVLYDRLDVLVRGPGLGIQAGRQLLSRSKVGDRWFLSGTRPNAHHPPWLRRPSGFMLAEEVAEPLLTQIASMSRVWAGGSDPLPPMVLPTSRPILSRFDTDGGPLEYVLFPDGLAYALTPRVIVSTRSWSVEDGLSDVG